MYRNNKLGQVHNDIIIYKSVQYFFMGSHGSKYIAYQPSATSAHTIFQILRVLILYCNLKTVCGHSTNITRIFL